MCCLTFFGDHRGSEVNINIIIATNRLSASGIYFINIESMLSSRFLTHFHSLLQSLSASMLDPL